MMSGESYSTIIQHGTKAVAFFNPQLERREGPLDPLSKPSEPKEEGSGPRRPDLGFPDKENLLKRMRKVDPKQAERYRQRTGE